MEQSLADLLLKAPSGMCNEQRDKMRKMQILYLAETYVFKVQRKPQGW